ncbi:hypothetical protein HYALB_00012257 [Hymenoscyphus albidus]|uniref:AGC-kinase C-terminal domain-containing protein n=1 Tax=Hymenoscyphus albidus TaxID=595503 RepID=A0A9N9Q8F8_9HELO|nr:hypothetical protein HYALB_00012257 [Hymenoscyphus albidus]
MFSYLRPHHKRTPSTPSSPAEQPPSFEPPHHPIDHGHPHRRQESIPPNPAPFEPATVTRTATGGDLSNDSSRFRAGEREPRTQGWESSKGPRPGNGFSFTNHQRMPSGRPDSAGNAGPANYSTSQSNLSPQSGEGTSRQKSPEYYIADGQNNSIPTGRRPIGARLPTPPPAENVSKFEPAPSKSGKTRLNLLNPMSLLARRRTSHAIPQLSTEALVTIKSGNTSLENDFRIRGTVVHDFSAPRPRRNVPYNDTRVEDANHTKGYQRSPNPQSNDPSTLEDNGSGRWSGGNHTPVFTEDFEEEQYPAAGPHVRKANDLTDLPLPKPPYAKGAQRPLDLNVTAKSNDVVQKQLPSVDETTVNSSIPEPVPAMLSESVERKSIKDKAISIDASATPPKSQPSNKKGRSRNVSEVSARDAAAIPKHMKSTSSRFSFDMIGAAEQERLLEDRHRQRALEKQAEKANEDDHFRDFDDEYDFDGMNDDDGLEERIPGVNADVEDDSYGAEPLKEELDVQIEHEREESALGEGLEADHLPNAENLIGFSFQQSWLTPLSPISPGAAETPRDADGAIIGFAMTKNSPYINSNSTQRAVESPVSPVVEETPGLDTPQGLGLQVHGLDIQAAQDTSAQSASYEEVSPQSFPQPAKIDDDDLYFDDGIITGFGGEEQPSTFDESVFDNVGTDQYGRPLKPLSPSISTLHPPPTIAPDQPPTPDKPDANGNAESSDGASTKVESESYGSPPPPGVWAPRPSVSQHVSQHIGSQLLMPSQGLTQQTLAAYQSALAAAAFTAAANGKFRRDSLPIDTTTTEPEESQPGLITDSSKNTSHYEPFSPNYDIEDDFDYDDELEDDAIIAAANAEALASDYDGFYGQEFGFYSAPAAQEAEYANGGYFGPRGADGLIRAQSGRLVVREPNLTPITERSEYSNRNSMLSPGMFGFASPGFPSPGLSSLASPGLSQLAGLMSSPEYEAGEMSLNALMRLRRGAFGSSQPSLHSSTAGSPKGAGGPDDVSPSAHPPWSPGVPATSVSPAVQGHRRKNSAISSVSDTTAGILGEETSISGSPTVTFNTTALSLASPVQNSTPESDSKEVRPKLSRHKHSASAESISYLKEEDPVAGQRWVLERRRTGESGEVELLGREVVQGGI